MQWASKHSGYQGRVRLTIWAAKMLAVMAAIAAGFMVFSCPAQAQASMPATSGSSGLTVNSIINMSKAGLSSSVIIAEIRESKQSFKLTPDQLIQLKKDSVSNAVINAMLSPNAATPGTAASPQMAAKSSFPTDDGIYVNHKGKWRQMYPEIVNWKTGGVFKSFLSGGFVKGDINGKINGKNSRYAVFSPATFLIVLPHTAAITEYQLLHLHKHSNRREFRVMTGGILHASGGATRDAIPYTPKRVAPYTYRIILSGLKRGEYGFLPPGQNSSSIASSGMMYTFSVKE